MKKQPGLPFPAFLLRIDLRIALTLFALLLIFGMWLGTCIELKDSRERYAADARRDAQSLSRLFLEHAYRTVEAADQAAIYLRYRYAERGRSLDLAKEIDNGLVADNVYNLFTIVDAAGDVEFSSKPFTPVNLVDREHIRVHMHNSEDRLFISKPVFGRVSQRWSLQLTRRINHADGSFGGVVVVSMDPQYFTRLYHQVDVGRYGAISLIGADGIVRVRRIGNSDSMGEDVAQGKVFDAMRSRDSGLIESSSALDGRVRTYAYQKLQDYPLYAVVGIDMEERLIPYYHERDRTLLLVGLITIGILAVNAAMIWLANSLLRSKRQAMAANEAKSRFLSNMSHELRTPLNGVLGYAEVLRDELGNSPLADFATLIQKSGTRLLDMINAILELTALEDQRVAVNPQEENIRELVLQAIALHNPAAAEKGLHLECRVDEGVPQVVFCDARKILRVLDNLLSNAVRYTERGRIAVRVSRPVAAKLEVQVQDTGVGVPLEQRNKIFEKFSQADDSARRVSDGAGLGLTIAQRLVTLMGGELVLSATGEQGSVFSFTLPLQESRSMAAA